MNLYCPHTATCLFYQNWVEQMKKKRVDVIFTKKRDDKLYYMSTFNCLPLMALNEIGILINDELKNRLLISEERNFACSNITLLNLLTKLDRILK